MSHERILGSVRLKLDQADLEIPTATMTWIAQQAAALVIAQLDEPDATIFYDVESAARFLRVTRKQIRDLIRANQIPHSRSEVLGRRDPSLGYPVCFRKADLLAWLTEHYDSDEQRLADAARATGIRRRRARDQLLAFSTSADPDSGWVYFARSRLGGDLIKIGWTKDIPGRMSDLKAELIVAVKGTRDYERALHSQFHHLRRDGEWFLPAEELSTFIDSIHNGNTGVVS